MSFLLVYQQQATAEVKKLIVDGLLPIKDRFPLTLVGLKDGQFVMIDGVTHLVVVDRSRIIPRTPREEKKGPEVELVTYIGKCRETIVARKYARSYCTKVPRIDGVTVKGRPFTTYNCESIAIETT
jgi:hypothetical protein